MNLVVLVSKFFNHLQIRPFLTNSIKPPPFLSLSFLARKSVMLNWAESKLLSNLVSLSLETSNS